MISNTEFSSSTEDSNIFIFYIEAVKEEKDIQGALSTYKKHANSATNYAAVTFRFSNNEQITCTASSYQNQQFGGTGHAERYALANVINKAMLVNKLPIFLQCQKNLTEKFKWTFINTSLFSILNEQQQFEIFRIFKPALATLTSITIYTEREPCNNSKYSCENLLNEILKDSSYKIYYSIPYVSYEWEQDNMCNYKVNELDSLMQYTDTQLQLKGELLDPVTQYYYNYYQKNFSNLEEYVEKLELILQYKGILTGTKLANKDYIQELTAILEEKKMTNAFYNANEALTKVNETAIDNLYQALKKEENALNIKMTQISNQVKNTERSIENVDEKYRHTENRKEGLNKRLLSLNKKSEGLKKQSSALKAALGLVEAHPKFKASEEILIKSNTKIPINFNNDTLSTSITSTTTTSPKAETTTLSSLFPIPRRNSISTNTPKPQQSLFKASEEILTKSNTTIPVNFNNDTLTTSITSTTSASPKAETKTPSSLSSIKRRNSMSTITPKSQESTSTSETFKTNKRRHSSPISPTQKISAERKKKKQKGMKNEELDQIRVNSETLFNRHNDSPTRSSKPESSDNSTKNKVSTTLMFDKKLSISKKLSSSVSSSSGEENKEEKDSLRSSNDHQSKPGF